MKPLTPAVVQVSSHSSSTMSVDFTPADPMNQQEQKSASSSQMELIKAHEVSAANSELTQKVNEIKEQAAMFLSQLTESKQQAETLSAKLTEAQNEKNKKTAQLQEVLSLFQFVNHEPRNENDCIDHLNLKKAKELLLHIAKIQETMKNLRETSLNPASYIPGTVNQRDILGMELQAFLGILHDADPTSSIPPTAPTYRYG